MDFFEVKKALSLHTNKQNCTLFPQVNLLSLRSQRLWRVKRDTHSSHLPGFFNFGTFFRCLVLPPSRLMRSCVAASPDSSFSSLS